MSHEQNRMRLAEAMGFWQGRWFFRRVWFAPPEVLPQKYIHDFPHDAFNPFTSADDDYVVLEWMRKWDTDKWPLFESALTLHAGDPFVWCYQIGDYAKAAITVLDEESP